ncbi:hypothetical protein CRE_04208 [Caenorhabditis remanei]|uniref:Sdz-33 F-box domain-containing protein n=1 Tax=Caenorhabditis remanei TaxID=31234 RepID=E3MYP9_CAERE|nr:hypothetical protein CRE_04208 [Caenorhabditis remanei]
MTNPFRLFSLPFLPLKKVLDNFGPHGIIILSLCSQRSKSIAVTYSGPSKDVKLQLMYYNGIDLCHDFTDLINVDNVSYLEHLEDPILPTVPIGKFRNVQYEMDGDCLVTYWYNELTGLTEIGNYAREIFNRDISQVSIGGADMDNYKRLIKWAMDTQGYIRDFYFEPENTLDEDLDYVLENVKCTGCLSITAKPSENYRPAKPLVCDLDQLAIHYGFWIKQEDLLTINCRVVRMEGGSKLTSQNFNVFLKHWMTGGCSKLKLFHVSVEETINYETVLDGVEFIGRGDDVKREYVNDENAVDIMTGGFDVKRQSDNITATITESSKRFYMNVWPDFAGNSY